MRSLGSFAGILAFVVFIVLAYLAVNSGGFAKRFNVFGSDAQPSAAKAK